MVGVKLYRHRGRAGFGDWRTFTSDRMDDRIFYLLFEQW